ncbi:hypothetical protein [Acidiphilium sp.]|uniref:hypothetical protein n=1 Tax=Acidiphilium sp. TaxID=527 RepID=UPI003D026A3A
MLQDRREIITKLPANNNSPRLADIVARADKMAAELAALAGSPTQAAIVASIAHAALARAFGGRT